MPAPTALQRKPEDVAEAANIPLPIDQDDELLLDAPDAELDMSAVQAGADTEMHIDEEGRPRFPESKGVVCYLRYHCYVQMLTLSRMSPSALKPAKFPSHHTA